MHWAWINQKSTISWLNNFHTTIIDTRIRGPGPHTPKLESRVLARSFRCSWSHRTLAATRPSVWFGEGCRSLRAHVVFHKGFQRMMVDEAPERSPSCTFWVCNNRWHLVTVVNNRVVNQNVFWLTNNTKPVQHPRTRIWPTSRISALVRSSRKTTRPDVKRRA